MAEPLMPQEELPARPRTPPRTVLRAKFVRTALITYADENGQEYTQLVVVGDNNLHLLEGRSTGFSQIATPVGLARQWLRDGAFKLLGLLK